MAHTDKPDHRRPGPQARRAIKKVCQYIHIHQLNDGDRLPPHHQMAAEFAVSNDTLMTAMGELTACGMLQRRARLGTIIANKSAMPTPTWSVGIVTVPAAIQGPASVFADLTNRLQTHAAAKQWRSATYYSFRTSGGMRLADYGPLEEDLADGLLDALIVLVTMPAPVWTRMRDEGLVMYHTPFDERARCGLIVNEADIATQATNLFIKRDCRSLALVRMGNGNDTSPLALHAMQKTAAAHGMPASALEYFQTASPLQGSKDLVAQLLARPEQDRPEALIVMDDYVALGMTEMLAQQGDYRPHIAVTTHLQLPLGFHLPVVRFEIDLHAMTQQIIEEVHARLLNPALPQTLQFISPVPPTHRPQQITSIFNQIKEPAQ